MQFTRSRVVLSLNFPQAPPVIGLSTCTWQKEVNRYKNISLFDDREMGAAKWPEHGSIRNDLDKSEQIHFVNSVSTTNPIPEMQTIEFAIPIWL